MFVFTPRRERGGVARFGHLSGLTDLSAGKRLEVVPYALGRGLFVQGTGGDPFRDASDFQRGSGMDVLYRATTSMTLTGTVNPDFGQVEVDPAVINLSAFETSFQENRPFLRRRRKPVPLRLGWRGRRLRGRRWWGWGPGRWWWGWGPGWWWLRWRCSASALFQTHRAPAPRIAPERGRLLGRGGNRDHPGRCQADRSHRERVVHRPARRAH